MRLDLISKRKHSLKLLPVIVEFSFDKRMFLVDTVTNRRKFNPGVSWADLHELGLLEKLPSLCSKNIWVQTHQRLRNQNFLVDLIAKVFPNLIRNKWTDKSEDQPNNPLNFETHKRRVVWDWWIWVGSAWIGLQEVSEVCWIDLFT